MEFLIALWCGCHLMMGYLEISYWSCYKDLYFTDIWESKKLNLFGKISCSLLLILIAPIVYLLIGLIALLRKIYTC